MFGQKQNKKEITANEEAVNVAGRYGRFKLSEGSKIGKEGEPFVDAPVAREALKIPTKYDSGLRLQCTEALNHPLTEIFMIILTIIALYITDSNQVLGSAESDIYVQYFCLFIMFVFFVELVMLSYSKEGYFLRDTYFWLDLLACASMLGDIPAVVMASIIPSGMVAAKAGRAGRAARAGTRAGRIVRLVRLTRLMRLTKLVRIGRVFAAVTDEVTVSERANKEHSVRRMSSMVELAERFKTARIEQGKNTVAASMVEMTISKVIVGILLMLFVMSMLEVLKVDNADENSLNQIYTVVSMGLLSPHNITTIIDEYFVQQPLCIYLRVNDIIYSNRWDSFDDQRSQELSYLFLPVDPPEDIIISAPGKFEEAKVEAWYDSKDSEDIMANVNIFTTSFVIALLLGWMYMFHKNARNFAQRIAVPLQKIGADMSKVSRLEFLDVTGDQQISSNMLEIQYIQQAFYKMKNAINSFSKYVPREIVLNMTLHKKMAKLGVMPRQISIFFSDIAGFTTICEKLEPNEVLKMLSEYFTAMSKVIIETEGILLEFIGDAILAIWNAPYDVNNHAVACISATLRMQQELVRLREEWSAQGYPEIHIRCGVHTDSVFVGNLGAPDRMKYGVMGDGVNLASRLEELNKRYGTKNLISDKTYGCARVEEMFVLRHVDRVVVKGRSKSTDLYEVCGFAQEHLDQKVLDFNKLYDEGMKLYFEREFSNAFDKFDEAKSLKESEEDESCSLLQSRCLAYMDEPPDKDWDGSSILTSK
jgi:class 3 adenylate cyclase